MLGATGEKRALRKDAERFLPDAETAPFPMPCPIALGTLKSVWLVVLT